jgi:hypothetical protein
MKASNSPSWLAELIEHSSAFFNAKRADRSSSETIFPNQKQTMKLNILIHFDGVTTVMVPDHLSNTDAKLLAEKVALARIVATIDKQDGPEDDAFDDYFNHCLAKATAEQDWDNSQILCVGGKWTVEVKP